MKKQVKFVSILIICIMLLSAMGIKADAKKATWKKMDYNMWIRGSMSLYISENSLMTTPFQPHSMGIRNKLASWKMDSSADNLKLLSAYKNTAYVVFYREAGKATLYSVNIKRKKKRIAARNCYAFATKGTYIYGNPFDVTDTGAYPVYIWKINGNSVKKIKKIGKHIFGTVIVKNKVYYGSYPSNSQKKMTVYRCDLDGAHPQKLFTVKAKGKYGQALLGEVTKKTVQASASKKNGSTLYEYNLKTGKLKKKTS